MRFFRFPASLFATAAVLLAVLVDPAGAATAQIKLPPVNAGWDLQLGGAYTPAAGVRIVDRDRTAKPVPGKYNICYINAFQTQDNEATFWTEQHPDLLLTDDDGKPLEDPDWPGEYALDTTTAAKRAAIAKIEGAWIDDCAARGFQAVDPDNLDTWTRWPGRLTKAGNLDLASRLATRAHARGLAIGQKNAAELGSTGRTRVKFDFAVVESCQVYAECGVYTKAYGRHVLEVEYTDDARSAYTSACKARGTQISIILRDHNLVARGRPRYHYEAC
jgi:endo-alpha-1,4-polygalactosaminidase (GH114 family)